MIKTITVVVLLLFALITDVMANECCPRCHFILCNCLPRIKTEILKKLPLMSCREQLELVLWLFLKPIPPDELKRLLTLLSHLYSVSTPCSHKKCHIDFTVLSSLSYHEIVFYQQYMQTDPASDWGSDFYAVSHQDNSSNSSPNSYSENNTTTTPLPDSSSDDSQPYSPEDLCEFVHSNILLTDDASNHSSPCSSENDTFEFKDDAL